MIHNLPATEWFTMASDIATLPRLSTSNKMGITRLIYFAKLKYFLAIRMGG